MCNLLTSKTVQPSDRMCKLHQVDWSLSSRGTGLERAEQ
ncbi:hypothetical protein [Streptomyces phage phiScoe15]|nr:hypothetical protein [Streptomyces phage phiScoe15]